MKQATQKEVKEYLKNSRVRKNLYCEYCLKLRGSKVMGTKRICIMTKPYIKEGKHYGWALICPYCESREVLGY